jgi:hypothetical protein
LENDHTRKAVVLLQADQIQTEDKQVWSEWILLGVAASGGHLKVAKMILKRHSKRGAALGKKHDGEFYFLFLAATQGYYFLFAGGGKSANPLATPITT